MKSELEQAITAMSLLLLDDMPKLRKAKAADYDAFEVSVWAAFGALRDRARAVVQRAEDAEATAQVNVPESGNFQAAVELVEEQEENGE